MDDWIILSSSPTALCHSYEDPKVGTSRLPNSNPLLYIIHYSSNITVNLNMYYYRWRK